MQVVVVGAQEARAKLTALPGELRRSTQAATERAMELEAQAIRSDTPHLTGTLAGSIQVSVTKTAEGARGRAFSDLRYAPFVDRGTRQHGPGRHMFERGSAEAKAQVEDVYRAGVEEVAASAR